VPQAEGEVLSVLRFAEAAVPVSCIFDGQAGSRWAFGFTNVF
jgi:hypothetical protein